MEIERKTASFWTGLHQQLFISGIHLVDATVTQWCACIKGDPDVVKNALFGEEDDFSCKDLLNVMLAGVRQSCIKLCAGADDLFPERLEDTEFSQITEIWGWNHVDELVEEFFLPTKLDDSSSLHHDAIGDVYCIKARWGSYFNVSQERDRNDY